MRALGLCAVSTFILALAACQTTGGSGVDEKYPVGRVGDVVTARYGSGLPITIYLPPNASQKVPIIVYHHGRGFQGWQDSVERLHPNSLAVTEFTEAGIAVAVPVRSGYHSAGGSDGERIPCNNPSRADFQNASTAARRDVIASIDFVRSMPEVDPSRVVLTGFSAGGFAAVAALAEVDQKVAGTVILGGGGRCGKRPPLLGGFKFAEEIVREKSAASKKPLVFVAGEYDSVVPIAAKRALHSAACEARGEHCASSVRFIKANEAKHRYEDILWPAREVIRELAKTGSL